MTKLTTERLEKLQDNLLQFQDSYSDPADKENYDIFVDALHVLDEFKSAKEKLLAYEQAAKNPVAFTEACEISNMNATGLYMRGFPDSKQGRNIPIYAAPVLPKQPELIGMKVSIDTGSDNIGHRLFGEIVGTSDSNGVPVLCIEVAENNADVTLADEGKTAKIVKAAEKLVRCKGRYHSEQNYRALAALFGVTVPDLPPLPSDEAPAQPVPMEFDAAWENKGHLFVDNKQYAALFYELGYKAAPAQPVIPEQNDFREKLIGLANHIASAANGIPFGWQDWADEIVTDLRSLASTAQPVSEPYKLAKSPEACAWISDGEGLWLGDCGLTWTFFDDGPNENGLKYCPSCGKKVSFIAAPAQESE